MPVVCSLKLGLSILLLYFVFLARNSNHWHFSVREGWTGVQSNHSELVENSWIPWILKMRQSSLGIQLSLIEIHLSWLWGFRDRAQIRQWKPGSFALESNALVYHYTETLKLFPILVLCWCQRVPQPARKIPSMTSDRLYNAVLCIVYFGTHSQL